MADDFFSNLQAVTSNIEDITFSRFATITSITGNYATVKEDESELEHTNVPLLNGVNLSVGDKVVVGFVDNSIYNPTILGAVGKTVHDDTKQDLLVSGTNIKTINHQTLLGAGNITIQGGGGTGGIIMVGSFTINNEGHLIATIPNGADNPYYINANGHLIYDTVNSHNEGEIT